MAQLRCKLGDLPDNLTLIQADASNLPLRDILLQDGSDNPYPALLTRLAAGFLTS